MDSTEFHQPHGATLGSLKTSRFLVNMLLEDSALAPGLTHDQQKLGDFWDKLSTLRNAFSHHGMRRQVVVGKGAKIEKKIEEIKEYWNTLKTCGDLPVPLKGTIQQLLVSPVGRRPGVLYSALHACRREGMEPDACLVLVSDDTSNAVDEALRAAEFKGEVFRVRIVDPYGGKSEVKSLAKDVKKHLATAQSIAVNLTGGTTLMGLVVAEIADEARKFGCNVRRFGLIDRRPPTEQDADPYRASEAFWLGDQLDED